MSGTATKKNPEKSEAEAKTDAFARAKRLAPQLAIRIGSTPATTFRGNPDIFGRLVEDHDHHRALIAMVEETSGDSPDRRLLFAELTSEMQAHAAAEEQALWSSVLRNPDTTDDGRHAVAEHYQIDKLIAELDEIDMTSPAWLRRFSALKDKYLHHLREEEQEQFVAAEEHLNEADLRHIHSVFERRKQAEKAAQ